MLSEYLLQVQQQRPMVHCITNNVSINDCANMVLACGAAAIMANDPLEVEEITSACDGLVINIGMLNPTAAEAMVKAGKRANALGHPVILDPVGAGGSQLRKDAIRRLLQEVKFTAIRGNASEIKAVALGSDTVNGVEVNASDQVNAENLTETVNFARRLAKQTGAVIIMTGKQDLIVDENNACLVSNGHAMMSRITGSGCMLTCLIGSYLAAVKKGGGNYFDACVTAVAEMGVAGELAYEDGCGTMTFRMRMIDGVSTMTAETLERGANIEYV